jgi:hypothetical protein
MDNEVQMGAPAHLPMQNCRVWSVRQMGQFAILGSIVFLALFAANLRSRLSFHGSEYGFLFWISLYCAVTGVGLIRFKKWAVLLAFSPALAFGAILTTSLRTSNGPDAGVFFMFALFAFFIAVPIRMFRYWKDLRW